MQKQTKTELGSFVLGMRENRLMAGLAVGTGPPRRGGWGAQPGRGMGRSSPPTAPPHQVLVVPASQPLLCEAHTRIPMPSL